MEIAIARAAVKMLKFQTDPLPPGALNCLDRSQNESPRLPAPYKPVGKCIYCSAERYRPGSHASLSDEHIIPLSIGGQIVLPKASCAKCENITTTFEDKCAKGFFHARSHLGIRGRKSKKAKTRLPIIVSNPGSIFGKLVTLPLDNHPGIILNALLQPAGILTGAPDAQDYKADVKGIEIIPGAMARLRA